MSKSKEQLNALLDGHEELKPLIHDILAENHITENAYAGIFRLIYNTMASDPSQEIAFCAPTKEWKMGKHTLSDVKVLSLMARVCDIVRYYTRTSWEADIYSAWKPDDYQVEAEGIMDKLESFSHIRAILKLAAANMVYNSDGKIDFGTDAETDDTDEDV